MLRRSSQIRSRTRKSCEIETASPDSYSNRDRRHPTRRHTAFLRLRRFTLYIRRNTKEVIYAITVFSSISMFVVIFTSGSRSGDHLSVSRQLHHHEHKLINGGLPVPAEHYYQLDYHKPMLSPTHPMKHFESSFEIIFKGKNQIDNAIPTLSNLTIEASRTEVEYESSDLDIKFLVEDNAIRNIWVDSADLRNSFRHPDEDRDDDVKLYYAFDDDMLRDQYNRDPEYLISEDEDKAECRRISEHRLHFPTCNSYHEINLIESNVKYLNAGAYRQVMVADHALAGTSEKIILKDLHFTMHATSEHYEFVRMDGIIAERLTSSPRIYDLYSMCGLGLVSEFFPHGDMETIAIPDWEVEPDEGYDPKNNFTAHEKLVTAKQMADAVADLHGYAGGVMVHQDIQLSQFLWNNDKSMVKLNDFNRAEFMMYNEEDREYCKYYEGRGMGSWRSAEEYYNLPVDEKVDIFSLGNNFFGILTGVGPFYKLELEDEEEKIIENVKHGMKAPIYQAFRDHSFEEKKLTELIDWCHENKPENRPSIFEIVEFLDKALKESLMTEQN